MGMHKENIDTFWIRLEHFLSPPEIFWGEAALTTVYTINHIPSPIIGNISPFERLHNHPLDSNMLKVFASTCFVLLQPHEYTKL